MGERFQSPYAPNSSIQPPVAGGSVQQGLSTAGGSRALLTLRLAADKRYSLGTRMNAPDQSDAKSTRPYRLLAPDGATYQSADPGQLGGYRPLRIYGRLDCWSARKFLVKGGYASNRVFFANEQSAIAAGYRPCGHCLRAEYKAWKCGGVPGTVEYPWLLKPASTAAPVPNNSFKR